MMLSSTSPVFSGEREASCEIAAELAFQHAVEAFQFLLFAQADAVFAGLAAAMAVHARGSDCAARWRTWGFRSGCP